MVDIFGSLKLNEMITDKGLLKKLHNIKKSVQKATEKVSVL